MIPHALVPAVLALLLASCSGNGGGSHQQPAGTVILPASQVHEGWFFATGQKVIIEGTVNGDLFAAAGTVEVSGTVNGDLLVAGGDVNVSGTVTDDIRAAGGTVRIDGTVGKNVTVAGGNVSVGRKAEISGGVLAFCGNLHVSGPVKKDLMVYGGITAVSGSIGGSVTVYGEEFSTLPGAEVAGNVNARLGDESRLKIAEGSVSGTVDFKTSAGKEPTTILGYSTGAFWFKVLWTLWLLLTGLMVFVLFRRVFVGYCAVLRQRTVSTILWGVCGIVLLPLVMVILAMTLIGIPFAILLLDIYFWLSYFSQLSTALLVGDLIFRNRESGGMAPFWAFTVGLLIVQGLTFIPYLGWLIVIIGLVLGFGALQLLIGGGWSSLRASVGGSKGA
jgi:hypothetical protein